MSRFSQSVNTISEVKIVINAPHRQCWRKDEFEDKKRNYTEREKVLKNIGKKTLFTSGTVSSSIHVMGQKNIWHNNS